jgi:hypothetical protein
MRFHRYSVIIPSGFGGLPAPWFQPWLKGRNRSPTKKQIAKQRSELLDQVRELLHDGEEQGEWEAVTRQLQSLLDFVRFQSSTKS